MADWSQYIYLIGGLIAIPYWIFVFLKLDKTERARMIIFGIIASVLSIIAGRFYFIDYWHPVCLTDCSIFSIEDILYGFFFIGAIAGTMPLLFREKIKGKVKANWKIIITVAVSSLIIGSILYYIFSINSAYVTAIMLTFIGVFELLYLKKRDSLWRHISVGLVAVVISVVVYPILFLINPDILSQWHMDKLSGIAVLWQPLEDLVFHFLAGFAFSSIYELFFVMKEMRISRKKTNS